MAWTKIKTATLTTAIVLIASLGTVVMVNYARHAPPRQTGRLKLPTGPVTPMIAYSNRQVLILAGDGSLWTWGENKLGWPVLGLADTNLNKTAALRRIGHDMDWASVSAGIYHCVGIKSDGSLWAWGGNFNYLLGDGTKTTRWIPVPSVPALVTSRCLPSNPMAPCGVGAVRPIFTPGPPIPMPSAHPRKSAPPRTGKPVPPPAVYITC